MQIITKTDIDNFEESYRRTFINSLAGFRQVVLVGTRSQEGNSNLAIFSSLVHLGSSPALFGLVTKSGGAIGDMAHTLQNILDTKKYTLNYLPAGHYKQAHQASAHYPKGVSEFDKTGLREEYLSGCTAPFVAEAVVKIALQFEEKMDIRLNDTTLIIGSVVHLAIAPSLIGTDGFIGLSNAQTMISQGLDAYFTTTEIGRLPYARP